jgi:hypothetical protein
MMDPNTEAAHADAVRLRAELQALADELAGVPEQVVSDRVGQQLQDLVFLARRAGGHDETDALLRLRAFVAWLQPRLTRLGEAPPVPIFDMPLRQVADLVHRIRVELAATVEAQQVTNVDNNEDQRGLEAG